MAKQYSAEFKMEAVKRVESSGISVARVAAELGINENTLHGWIKRYRQKPADPFPGSGKISAGDAQLRKLEKENRELKEKIEINHNRIEHIMKKEGIRSKVARKFKATTNSNHHLPVVENILNREFKAAYPGEKMVSDITCVWTAEGWLYVAGIMDLYGQKIIGLSMGDRMTKELVITAGENEI